MKSITYIIIILVIVGCAGSPAHVSIMSVDQLKSLDTISLCHAYGVFKSDKVKAEIKRRRLIPAHEWPTINESKVAIGMSELALICSWGHPGFRNIHETTGSWGVHKQWVYERSRYYNQYVYTENGKVTSWQN